jgi:hypothetical protein
MIGTLASLGIGTYYIRYYACYLAGFVLVLLAVRMFRRRLPRRVRVIACVVVGVLFVRLLLFDNPGMLRLYQWALTSESLGQRQWGVLDLEIRKYRRDIHQPKLANLAVGSSQVGAIFYHWVSDPPQPLAVYSLAGMKTLDFVLNEDAIAAFNPARVILYMSAFDMTGSPELFSLPLAPPRPLAMWSVYARLRASGLTAEETAPSIHAYVASQLVPEYRYSFVYRAMLRQWLGAAPRPVVPAEQRLPEFSSYFDPQWLDYNFLFFRDFLTFCEARGIEVVVAEGQINPAARTPAIDALNAMVRSRMMELLLQFKGLRYVPASEVYEFTAAEYHDMTHVLPEAASRYTARLSAYLTK